MENDEPISLSLNPSKIKILLHTLNRARQEHYEARIPLPDGFDELEGEIEELQRSP